MCHQTIRSHPEAITRPCSFKSYPEEDKTNPEAYKAAIDALQPGSAVIIFTPDSMFVWFAGQSNVKSLS